MEWIKLSEVPDSLIGRQVVLKDSDHTNMEPYWLGYVEPDKSVVLFTGDELSADEVERVLVLVE